VSVGSRRALSPIAAADASSAWAVAMLAVAVWLDEFGTIFRSNVGIKHRGGVLEQLLGGRGSVRGQSSCPRFPRDR
jgi:hypothetical protein